MTAVGYIVLGVFAGVLACSVAAGLWRVVGALLAGDVALAKRLALPLLRVSLWLAGAAVLAATHGRSYRIATLLGIAAGLLQLPRDWPALRSGLWPSRDKPAA